MIKYDIFTYQISPISNSQFQLFGENYSYDELVKNKNQFFTNLRARQNCNKWIADIPYGNTSTFLIQTPVRDFLSSDFFRNT